MPELGIIVLGQTPRLDLEKTYGTLLPGVSISIGGALDQHSEHDIEALTAAGGEYPLLVILADGTTREISMYRLLPLLEQQAVQMAEAGIKTTLLMCAGNFPDLQSPVPVIYPGRVVPAVALGLSSKKHIGIVTPNKGQVKPAQDHWKEKGFTTIVTVASPKSSVEMDLAADFFKDRKLDLIVLDCMGFGPESAKILRQKTTVPVICAQSLVARIVAEMLGN